MKISRVASGNSGQFVPLTRAPANVDVLVHQYGRPRADPSSSDSYLIEIGRLTGVASQGFALPEERDRQAISSGSARFRRV